MSDVVNLLSDDHEAFRRITAGDLIEQLDSADPPVIVDVPSRSQYLADPRGIEDGIRMPLDEIDQWARSSYPAAAT